MNIFRFLGDLSHIFAFIILLHKIVKGKSAAGISLKTQEMYAGMQRAPLPLLLLLPVPPAFCSCLSCLPRARQGSQCQLGVHQTRCCLFWIIVP